MRALVTGAAGFIGSNLCDRLLAEGYDVVGIDCFTDYYDQRIKRSNIAHATNNERFVLLEENLLSCDLGGLLGDIDVVFHQAGQPGVRLSWAAGFETYTQLNVLATQRLLEAAKSSAIQRFVYASSSSLYGSAAHYPTSESDLPAPMSPYGVTKLAAEHLCSLYFRNYGVPTVSLRYFTVYGPRQRPDMATHRLIRSALDRSVFTMFGDGTQIRDFTFVADAVEANVAAATTPDVAGSIVNVVGGSAATMLDVVEGVTAAAGMAPNIVFSNSVAGDVFQTGADIAAAQEVLGWRPVTPLLEGIAAQVASLRADV